MDSARARTQQAAANIVDLSSSPPLRPTNLPPVETTTLHSRYAGQTIQNMPTGSIPSNSQYPATPPGTSAYDSPPTTPKGHPINHNANDYLGRQSLIGFLGGGGTGVKPGMKGSMVDRKHVMAGIGGARKSSTAGDTLERMQAKRFAAGLQKAYVVHPSSAAAHEDVNGAPLAAAATIPHAQLQPDTYMKKKQVLQKAAEAAAAVVVPFDPGHVDFTMTKREETAALISFITSTTNNALPATLDVLEPLDPQLVLDFDYTRPTALEDLAALVHDTYTMYPVVLFGQMRDPYYREMRKLFSAYVVNPPPLVVEVDQRADEEVLVGLLKRLLGITELPVLMLNGESPGSWPRIQNVADNGNFMKLIAMKSSAKIHEKKLKKRPKGVKDAERAENERILAPKPLTEG
ncbi:hypothetical protein QFC22_000024 [Naganishia vaughanmartiniae]|uniref:Uncharacterized protein n=1 Tax=Naganishia vaughanmartiniae TaxID=1424756 RepID=A0ACC2XNX6_9TREE|nr:hypothetical protein QFC22_000024 [Naganishia vaughanmartiniae]